MSQGFTAQHLRDEALGNADEEKEAATSRLLPLWFMLGCRWGNYSDFCLNWRMSWTVLVPGFSWQKNVFTCSPAQVKGAWIRCAAHVKHIRHPSLLGCREKKKKKSILPSGGWISSSSLFLFQGQSCLMFVFSFIIHAHWCCDATAAEAPSDLATRSVSLLMFWKCSPDCSADWPFPPTALPRGNPLPRAAADGHKASLIGSQDQRTDFIYLERVFLTRNYDKHHVYVRPS